MTEKEEILSEAKTIADLIRQGKPIPCSCGSADKYLLALADELGRESEASAELQRQIKLRMDEADKYGRAACTSEPGYPDCCTKHCDCQSYASVVNALNIHYTGDK